MRWRKANICLHRDLPGDQDPGHRLLPLFKIPSSLRRPRGLAVSRAEGCRLPPTMWPPGASGGPDLGGGVPALPCGPRLRSAMRPPTPRAGSRGGTSGAAAAPSSKAAPGRSYAASHPSAGRQPPPNALSPNSPLPHLTWPRGSRFSTAKVPLPPRADLAPGPRPGVAAQRPLPRGGLAARRPPPCVAPTSPVRPQPSPRAPTRARARAFPHLTLLTDRTPCSGRCRSPLPPPRPPRSSISTPRPEPGFRARAPRPFSPRANALT